MQPFRRLAVWRKAHELARRVYRSTNATVWREHPGLAAQMQRASFSVAYNIAEGSGRDTPARFAHALELAFDAAHELDYQLLLARDLGVLDAAEHARLEARVGEAERMLVGLRRTVLKAEARRGRAPSSLVRAASSRGTTARAPAPRPTST